MSNVPTEIDLLRKVASAAQWAIEANGDHVIGQDGRVRVGINEVMAHSALNRALGDLREHYSIDVNLHLTERSTARGLVLEMQSRTKKSARR